MKCATPSPPVGVFVLFDLQPISQTCQRAVAAHDCGEPVMYSSPRGLQRFDNPVINGPDLIGLHR
jgi:hypothetical protein